MTGPAPPEPFRLGVLADTHGLVRPEALTALEGSHLILHAGDVGGVSVLEALARVAPVAAVRGNVDRGSWALSLPKARTLRVCGLALRLVHDLGDLDEDPTPRDLALVLCGHSHRPAASERAGVLYLNPGSAGPRRFRLPVCLARLVLARSRVCLEWVPLAGA